MNIQVQLSARREAMFSNLLVMQCSLSFQSMLRGLHPWPQKRR